MFWLTKAHDQKHESKPNFKIGTCVPNNAVNLAYVHSTLPSVEKNIKIIDTTSYIPFNEDLSDLVTLREPDRLGSLGDEINGRMLILTNIFEDENYNNPLFYRYILKHKISIENGPRERSLYDGKAISIKADRDYALNNFKHKIYITPYPENSLDTNLYTVEIFVNVSNSNPISYYAIYNGINDQNIIPNIKEKINAVPYFKRAESYNQVHNCNKPNQFIYYQTFNFNIFKSKVYVPRGCNTPYAIKALDRKNIILLPPNENDPLENWHLKVQNGYFEQNMIDHNGQRKTYAYFIPDYYKQNFKNNMPPVIQVKNERAIVIDKKHIKLKNKPLVVLDSNDIDIYVNNQKVPAISWDINSGIIEVGAALTSTDQVKVSYFYEEYSYIYRGYYDDTNQRRYFLDLNPSAGHTCTLIDSNGEANELPSYKLLNKVVYIYLRAAAELENIVLESGELADIVSYTDDKAILELKNKAYIFKDIVIYTLLGKSIIPKKTLSMTENDTWWEFAVTREDFCNEIIINKPNLPMTPERKLLDKFIVNYYKQNNYYRFKPNSFRQNVIIHRYEPFTEKELADMPDILLLGQVYVRAHTNLDYLTLVDTRQRGGGVKEKLIPNAYKYEPATEQYWDIGNFDGKQYQESGLGIVKLPKTVLKEFGGKFTKKDVEVVINKYLAWGNLALIEYVDIPNIVIQKPEHLVITSEEISEAEAFLVQHLVISSEV